MIKLGLKVTLGVGVGGKLDELSWSDMKEIKKLVKPKDKHH